MHYSQIWAPNSYTQTLRKNLVDIFLPPSKWNLRFKNNWKSHVLKNLPPFKNMSTTFPCIYNRLWWKKLWTFRSVIHTIYLRFIGLKKNTARQQLLVWNLNTHFTSNYLSKQLHKNVIFWTSSKIFCLKYISLKI